MPPSGAVPVDDEAGLEGSPVAKPVADLGRRPTIRLLRFGLAAVPCMLAILFARVYLIGFSDPASYYRPFTDAVTYLAAGERLNAGHDLYRLVPGDRLVALQPDLSPSPILSPPPIAVLWRPLAALPFGFAAWAVAVWLSMLVTLLYVGLRGGLAGLVLAFLLSRSTGEQLAAGNVAAFFPGLLILAWKYRDSALCGFVIGTMASIKLSPASMFGWLIGERRWRAVTMGIGAVVVAIVVSALGAGVSSIGDYVQIALQIKPSPMSISGRTGVAWLSSAFLIGGTLMAIAVGRRWPAASFAIGVASSVVGTPALYLSGWVTMLAVVAPLTDGNHSNWWPLRRDRSRPTKSNIRGLEEGEGGMAY